MIVTIHPLAEAELVDGSSYYAREADTALGEAFIAEFSRCVELLREHPQLGAPWSAGLRRFPVLARSDTGTRRSLGADATCLNDSSEITHFFDERLRKLISEDAHTRAIELARVSVPNQCHPSSPPPGLWFYRGDNYSDAGGYSGSVLLVQRPAHRIAQRHCPPFAPRLVECVVAARRAGA